MSMIRWDPARDLMSLRQAMEKLFEDSVIKPSSNLVVELGGGNMPVDMYQTDNELIIKAAIPGVKPEEVDISITGDTLTIKGEKKEEKEIKEKEYIRRESRYGAFSRNIVLPMSVKSEGAEATFENGILTLKLPKAEEAKPKQIRIKGARPTTSE